MPEVRNFCPLMTKNPQSPVKCNTECALCIGTKCALRLAAEGLAQAPKPAPELRSPQKA